MSQKKAHRKGKMWAAKYLAGRTIFAQTKNISSDPDKEKTEYGDGNRARMKVQLSGEIHNTRCLCPRCKKPHIEKLPVEYLESPLIWRKEDKVIKMCISCGGRI
jgi:RNase P subunit RPR2